MSLRPTHHGYSYQDLITAIAFVDLMLGRAVGITVDTKGFKEDRFDDLTITRRDGGRTRIQIKHTAQDRELSKDAFSGDGRSLKLNLLFAALLKDLESFPETHYRLVVRDGAPDEELAKVLKSVAAPDTADPLPGVTTDKYRFDSRALRSTAPWKKLLKGLTDQQLEVACERLIVDTDAPGCTISMEDPGAAELALMRRVTEELGAGRPPNVSRGPQDVALALTHAANYARARDGNVTREVIAPRIGLTTDFGAVVDGHPVEDAVAVTRTAVIDVVRTHVDAVMPTGGRVILTGEPGVGKTWLCEQVASACRGDNWVVARHHCWLGASDVDRNDRVLSDVVIGSLLGQLELADPEATSGLRPRFAATPDALGAALRVCHEAQPSRPILIVVDGLDHVDRVLGRRTTEPVGPSRLLVDRLASVKLPPNVGMVIASQPGQHLDNAEPTAGCSIEVPRLTREEVRMLAQRHRLIHQRDEERDDPALASDESAVLDLLYARSGGNALYATYLCRQAARVSPLNQDNSPLPELTQVLERLRRVPASATDLDAYYAHLLEGITEGQDTVIGALAVCDFALSTTELAEMLPEASLFIDRALAALAPVLNSQPGLGGLRVHHESFSRHILRDKPETWVATVRTNAAEWLANRGFAADSRAFRHLPELLAHLDRYDELKGLIRPGFVADAVQALQPPEALKRVVGIVARESEANLDWPTLIACVETRKAIDVYENESLTNTLVRYADVVVSILGADTVAERLLYEGRPTFPSRWGLRLCRTIDRAGGSAPWAAYLDAHKRDKEVNSSSGSSDDGDLHVAAQLGHLRLRPQHRGFDDEAIAGIAEHLDQVNLHTDRDGDGRPNPEELLEAFASGLPNGILPAVAARMTDPANAARVYGALADLAAAGVSGLPAASELAREAQARAPTADIVRYLRHGVAPDEVLAGLGVEDLEGELLAATDAVVEARSAKPDLVERWLSLLALSQALRQLDPLRLMDRLAGVGFYLAWLRFAVVTVGVAKERAQGAVAPRDASAAVCFALEQLADCAEPFTGEPRACDLYFIHSLVHRVIEDAIVVVQPDDLEQVLTHLVAIGDGTTTTMMGMAESGPLATNDLLEILARVADQIGAGATHAVVAGVRDQRRNYHGMYSVAADFELAAARICAKASASDEAAECWARASMLLAAYGGHKDPTIGEFIDSVEDLAEVNPNQAREALAKLLDLAYLVRQHTDGRGTSHVPREWWAACARVDPIAAARDGADALLAEIGFEDVRVQTALETLLGTQAGSADPVVLASLRLSAGAGWRSPATDLEILTRLEPEVGKTLQADAVISSVANNIAASYDDQPMMYTSDAPKSVATPSLVEAVAKIGGTTFEIRVPREEPDRGGPALGKRDDDDDLQKRLAGQQRPILPEGPNGAVIAARDYERKDYRDDKAALRWDADALANAIGWRVLEVVQSRGAEAAIELLDDVAREIPTYSDSSVFVDVGAGLLVRCASATSELGAVAAYGLVLSFIRVRGGGGWRTFAGREGVDTWAAAYDLDPVIAEQKLAAAVADVAADSSMGLYGVTQAVVAALAAQRTERPGGNAVDCWNAGLAILQERLPGTAVHGHHVYRATHWPDDSADLDDALAALALASVSQAMRADLRRALLAAALLVTCRPRLGQKAIARVLEHKLDAGRATWLLELVREYVPSGPLLPELTEVITALAQTDRLSVRVLAAEILAGRGQPVPVPPATEPAPKVRLACSELSGAVE